MRKDLQINFFFVFCFFFQFEIPGIIFGVGGAFVPENRGQTPPGSAADHRWTNVCGKENLKRGIKRCNRQTLNVPLKYCLVLVNFTDCTIQSSKIAFVYPSKVKFLCNFRSFYTSLWRWAKVLSPQTSCVWTPQTYDPFVCFWVQTWKHLLAFEAYSPMKRLVRKRTRTAGGRRKTAWVTDPPSRRVKMTPITANQSGPPLRVSWSNWSEIKFWKSEIKWSQTWISPDSFWTIIILIEPPQMSAAWSSSKTKNPARLFLT